jgi:predicted metal-binding protein
MIRRAKSQWEATVLVCGKCSKKVGGGFGPKGKTPLAKALRRIFGKGRKASVGVVETKCLGLCPKNAVTLVDGGRPGEWLVVTPDEDVEGVAARLGRGA